MCPVLLALSLANCVLSPSGQVGAIIITPTRELAIQIDEVLSHFTKPFPQFR